MKRVVANPVNKRNNYHVSLTDSITSIGLVIIDAAGHARPKGISRNPTPRTALKTRSGEMKFDSFNEPWSPIAQESWLGGRANLEFDKDATRFLDSFCANTQYGYFSNGPLATYATGIRTTSQELPGSVKFLAIKPGDFLFFSSKRNILTVPAKYLYLILKRKGTPPADLTITIRSDNAGLPGTVLKTITITTDDITDVVSEFRRLEIPLTYGFTTGTPVWFHITTTTADEDNYWSIGVFDKTASSAKASTDGTNWVNVPYDLYYRITPADDADVQCKQFKYRYAEYVAMSINGAASALYMNGDRGMADVNTGHLDQLIDSVKVWLTDQWKGCVVKIVAGPGVTEWTNWRLITSNDASHLNVSPNWTIEHTALTEYVILGSDVMTTIVAAGTAGKLTKPVDYDPLVVNNIVYFPQGDATPLQRMQWNATTAVHDIVDDGTSKATMLQQCRDATNGLEIWRGQNSDATGIISVSKTSNGTPNWGTDLTWAAVIPLKDERGRITGIEEYGDTTKVPWIMREGSIYQIVSNKPDEIPLREMAAMMDTTNGRAHLVHNVYLYFNYGEGIERYYDKTLDDVGPNRDQGLPANRKGIVSCMVGYPGRYFAAVDAGADGYSSVLINNLTGWHELYRAPAIGQRIRSMDFQTVPGRSSDRLWVNVGNDVISLNFPSGGLDPLTDTNSRYTWESTITGSRMYVSMYDVIKFFRSFKLFADGLSEGQTVEMDYRMDEETEWHSCYDAFTDETREIFPIENYGVNGISLTYRLRILTDDCSKTVRGKALVLNNISRVPIKYSYGLPYRVVDYDMDLLGKKDEISAEAKQKIIDDWATNLTPLVMNCQYKQYDNKVVFIDPIPLNPLASHSEMYLGKLTIIEI